MNDERRRRIREVNDALDELKSDLEALAEEEQAAFDNMPEAFQDSTNGEAMTDAVEALEQASNDVEEIKANLMELV